MSTNAQESATTIGFGVTNKFWQVSYFTITESKNNEGQLYLNFHLTFKVTLTGKPWYVQLTDESMEVQRSFKTH